MDEREILFEIGPESTGVLPCALIVSIKTTEGQALALEVALDVDRRAESVFLSPDGGLGAVHALSPMTTGKGRILCLSASLVLSGSGLILEVLDPDQGAVADLSFYLRPDRERAFPMMRVNPGGPVSTCSWGPPGAQRWERAVNVTGAWTSELGIVLDLLVDDMAKTARVGALCRPSGRTIQAWLAPQALTLVSPGVARVWLPVDTTDADLSFFGSNGDLLESYSHYLVVASLPTLDPAGALGVPPRPTTAHGRLLGRPAPSAGAAPPRDGRTDQPGPGGRASTKSSPGLVDTASPTTRAGLLAGRPGSLPPSQASTAAEEPERTVDSLLARAPTDAGFAPEETGRGEGDDDTAGGPAAAPLEAVEPRAGQSAARDQSLETDAPSSGPERPTAGPSDMPADRSPAPAAGTPPRPGAGTAPGDRTPAAHQAPAAVEGGPV
ncbi:MAG: hypothetical protein HY815_27450, partial [Candidatus Riflebacteria bacterium]|nr:hypothetical protein [Candidatus Riflebacteria bacterium]